MVKILKTSSALLLLFFLACEKETPNQVVTNIPGISIHYFPDVILRTSEKTTLFMVKVNDSQGIENIKQVVIEIEQGGNLIATGFMWDDGQNGDIIAQNGTFTYSIIPNQLFLSSGATIFTFRAEDENGNFSPELQDTSEVKEFLINLPPQILSVSGPSTISRSQGGSHLLTATVSDPQGLSDIGKVFLDSFRPDGSPSSGNPFFMYDTGNLGDLQANDGIYSFQFTISPSNTPGEYRFEVQAQDKSGANSDKVVHIITVTL